MGLHVINHLLTPPDVLLSFQDVSCCPNDLLNLSRSHLLSISYGLHKVTVFLERPYQLWNQRLLHSELYGSFSLTGFIDHHFVDNFLDLLTCQILLRQRLLPRHHSTLLKATHWVELSFCFAFSWVLPHEVNLSNELQISLIQTLASHLGFQRIWPL